MSRSAGKRQAVLLVAACLATTGAARAEDWPVFLGPTGDGRSSETGLKLDWPATGPPVLWHVPLGEGYSMPSIAGDRLFVFDRHGDKARLSCLDRADGKELWRQEYSTDYEDRYEFSNGPRCSPVIDGDHVYTFGVEGRLRCHAVSDGKLIWEVDTAARFDVVENFFGVGSTPVVEGDLLITMIGGSPKGSPDIHTGEVEGDGSGIVAFDKRTGKVRYRVTDELASYSSPRIVTIGERRWGFAFARGGLVGFEPSTGKVDFRFPWRATRVTTVNAANPVVVDDTVFVTESYSLGGVLLRVKPGGYDVIWKDPKKRNQSLASHWSTPIYHEGYLYGCHGEKSGNAELRAVEHRTGKVAWSEPGLGRATQIFADGHLIVLGEDGRLTVVRASPKSFQRVAQARPVARIDGAERPLLESPAWNPPILSNGHLFVRGKDRLVCFDLSTAESGDDEMP